MTMPHLTNCPHSGEGWCLACVKKYVEEHQKKEASQRRECEGARHLGPFHSVSLHRPSYCENCGQEV